MPGNPRRFRVAGAVEAHQAIKRQVDSSNPRWKDAPYLLGYRSASHFGTQRSDLWQTVGGARGMIPLSQNLNRLPSQILVSFQIGTYGEVRREQAPVAVRRAFKLTKDSHD